MVSFEQKIREAPITTLQEKEHTMMKTALLFLLLARSSRQEEEVAHCNVYAGGDKLPCQENGVIASWCDSSMNPNLSCVINPSSDTYGCMCLADPSTCPHDCVGGTQHVGKTHYGIQCRGIPEDEPNYILRQGKLPLHHCENNAVVASWCNEWTVPDVGCLLLPALDEYVCTCHDNAAACPEDCVGGGVPDKKMHHAIRCTGIPTDEPNYVLTSK